MADVYISKSMKRARTLNRVNSQVGETIKISVSAAEDTTHPDITVRWHVQRVELIGTKKLYGEYSRFVPKTRHSERDPEKRAYDYKDVTQTFRLKGFIKKDTWNDSADVRDYCILIFEDGGRFTFGWQDDTYDVNVTNFVFYNEKRADGPVKINFTIDLMKIDKD